MKATRRQTTIFRVAPNAVENGEPLTDVHSVTPGSSGDPFGLVLYTRFCCLGILWFWGGADGSREQVGLVFFLIARYQLGVKIQDLLGLFFGCQIEKIPPRQLYSSDVMSWSCRAGEDFGGALVVAASDWSIIPAENLVAAFQNSDTKVRISRYLRAANHCSAVIILVGLRTPTNTPPTPNNRSECYTVYRGRPRRLWEGLPYTLLEFFHLDAEN